ncbi:hypothetical protein JD969_04795 [Planctomycetota bacterium]|nr:hypothetical protein JD969_04795 [Planctomycetota bacterium]
MNRHNPSKPSATPEHAATTIVKTLQDAGHIAYFAGGCVRDALLKRQPKDYDVATDAKPEIVRKLFPRSRYVGESFGVVLVYIHKQPIEVATFRKEWGYTDGRRPSEVAFTDAEHDAQRRDFTINGLFSDPLKLNENNQPTVIDYVGGIEDLKLQHIRAIGVPQERFDEDYLRMLRAIRFTARLDFKLDPATATAIKNNAPKLGDISRERIGQELLLMFTGTRPALAAELAQQLELDGPILTEENHPTSLATLKQLRPNPPYPVALAAWLIDRNTPTHAAETHITFDAIIHLFDTQNLQPILNRWRNALCLSNEDREALKAIILNLKQINAWTSLSIAQRKRMLASQYWNYTNLLAHAVHTGPFMDNLDTNAEQLHNDPIGLNPDPLVTGDDLVKLGFKPSPAFKVILNKAYDAQLEGLITTRENALQLLRSLSHT